MQSIGLLTIAAFVALACLFLEFAARWQMHW